MKAIQMISLCLVIFYLGCSKPEVKFEPAENSIVGKWTWMENFYSTGGPGQWHPVTPANQTIEFKSDGSFVSANSFLNGVTRYDLLDSVTIIFRPASAPSGYILMQYQINSYGRELYLQPADPRCVEGCSNKFRR
jgi:hypothetical protein